MERPNKTSAGFTVSTCNLTVDLNWSNWKLLLEIQSYSLLQLCIPAYSLILVPAFLRPCLDWIRELAWMKTSLVAEIKKQSTNN